MKRRTRKQWYEYHLGKSKNEERSHVYKKYADLIEAHEKICKVAIVRLSKLKASAPLLTRIADFWGADKLNHQKGPINIVITQGEDGRKRISQVLSTEA